MKTATRFILLSAAVVLGACSHEGDGTASLSSLDSGGARSTENAAAALNKANALRAEGKPILALSRLAEAHQRYPQDAAIASAYGRVALLLGHDAVAAPLLAQAVAANPRDWRALSAQGVLETRRGRLPDARRALAQAHLVSAREAVILNNIAVSQLLDGKPAGAISLLRQGLAAPDLRRDHERRLKRNLALALAVEGQFAEADRLAGERMPRDLTGADNARMRRLLGVSEAQLADGAGWKAQLATREPQAPALQ